VTVMNGFTGDGYSQQLSNNVAEYLCPQSFLHNDAATLFHIKRDHRAVELFTVSLKRHG
jgi:hypothetical protein